ncbi:MAG: hypothetical protein V1750_08900 [Acidobacteriota bacterium]
MPWMLDGNNLAGGRDRAGVRAAALDLARRERITLVVFFDGAPPPGAGAVERLGRVEIRYVRDADGAILAALGTGADWVVASDDRELQAAVRRAGGRAVPAAAFWQRASRAPQGGEPRGGGQVDIKAELAFFSDPANQLARISHRGPSRKRQK